MIAHLWHALRKDDRRRNPAWMTWSVMALVLYVGYQQMLSSDIRHRTTEEASAGIAGMECGVLAPLARARSAALDLWDISPGNGGQTITCGDTALVRIAWWDAAGEPHTALPPPMRVGEAAWLTGVDAGLLGMQAGGQRMVRIPPAWQGGAGAPLLARASAGAPLVVQLTVLSVEKGTRSIAQQGTPP